MMLKTVCLILQLSLLRLISCSWTQQYGDPASTNYIPMTKNSLVKTGWNYTGPGYSASIFYNSPAVSDEGVIFIPYLIMPEYFLQVRTVLPNGEELWMANWIGSDSKCQTVFMTNALYDSNRNMVIVGWYCIMAYEYEKAGQLVALNATDGSTIWRTSKLKVNDVATLSMTSDKILLSGGYDCGRDPTFYAHIRSSETMPNEVNDKKNESLIIAVDIDTGSVSWSMIASHAGCSSQTKLTPLKDGSSLAVFSVNLSPGAYLSGDVLSLKCPTSPHFKQAWLDNLKISYDAKFAFSDNGVMFGSYGFAGNPDLIFAMDIENNKILFSNRGYCGPNAYPSGPAVDKQGHAYYSCGSIVFAVDSKGSLLWKSKIYDKNGYHFNSLFKHSPAIHIDRELIIFVNTGSTNIYALSSKDGSLQGSSNITELTGSDGCTEPPIIVGDAVYLIKANGGHMFYYLYSVPLMKVLF